MTREESAQFFTELRQLAHRYGLAILGSGLYVQGRLTIRTMPIKREVKSNDTPKHIPEYEHTGGGS